MFLAYLLLGYCTVALLEQGLVSTARRIAVRDTELKYTVYQEKVTWDDARDLCDQDLMALAYIMTYQEQKDMRKYIEENKLMPKDEQSGYWLGARVEDGKWRWEFNEEDTTGDRNFMAGWHYNEPEEKRNQNGELAECMELKFVNTSKFTRSLSWNNLWCNEKRGFICQEIHKNFMPRKSP